MPTNEEILCFENLVHKSIHKVWYPEQKMKMHVDEKIVESLVKIDGGGVT